MQVNYDWSEIEIIAKEMLHSDFVVKETELRIWGLHYLQGKVAWDSGGLVLLLFKENAQLQSSQTYMHALKLPMARCAISHQMVI